jgi:hypothetical protein
MPDGGISGRFRFLAPLDQLFKAVPLDMDIAPGPVSGLPAEQLVNRNIVIFPGDVPKGDVDGADRPHHGGPLK